MTHDDNVIRLWLFGITLGIAGAAWLIRELRSRAAQSWPIVDGTAESTYVRVEGHGRTERRIAEVNYSYKVQGEFYSGAHEVRSEVDFEAFPKESRVVVHYKESDPSVSFLDREDVRQRRDRMMATGL